MDPQDAIDLGREALNMALSIGGPVVATGMVVGLVIGLLQAVTQVQEQTVSFVPKLLAMVLVLSLMLPWIVQQMVQYSHDLITNIPNTLSARMFSATGISPHQFLVFTLVLARVLPLLWIAPVLGSSEVPARVRVLLAVALAAVVTPLELTKTIDPPHTLIAWLLALGAEALVGLSLGLGILVLFSGMQLAGQAISQMSGMQLADVFDPGFETSQPVFSKLLFLVSLAVFVAIGGHHKTMEALLDTFAWLPAGQGGVSRSFTDAVTSLLSQSFALGVRAVAPAMVALVLATLVLALVSRTLPQLNLLVLGFGFNVLTTLAVLAISLSTAAWVFQDQIEPAWTTMLDGLRPK